MAKINNKALVSGNVVDFTYLMKLYNVNLHNCLKGLSHLFIVVTLQRTLFILGSRELMVKFPSKPLF